LTDPSTKGSDR